MGRRILSEGRYATVTLVEEGAAKYVEKAFRLPTEQIGASSPSWGTGSFEPSFSEAERVVEYYLKERAILEILGGRQEGIIRIPQLYATDDPSLTVRLEYLEGTTFQEEMREASRAKRSRLREGMLAIADSFSQLANSPDVQGQLLSLEREELGFPLPKKEEEEEEGSYYEPRDPKVITVEDPHRQREKLTRDLQQIAAQGTRGTTGEEYRDQAEDLAAELLDLQAKITYPGISESSKITEQRERLIQQGKLVVVHGDLTGSNCMYSRGKNGLHKVIDFSNVKLSGSREDDYVRAVLSTYPQPAQEEDLVGLLKQHNPLEGTQLREALRRFTIGRVVSSVNILGHNCEADPRSLGVIMSRQGVRSKEELISSRVGTLLDVIGFYTTGKGARELPRDKYSDEFFITLSSLAGFFNRTNVTEWRPASDFSKLFDEG